MKNSKVLLFAVFFGSLTYSSFAQRFRVKIVRQDSTFINNNGDSSLVYDAIIYKGAGATLTTFSLLAQSFDNVNQTWVTDKDTSYSWSLLPAFNAGNMAYVSSKPNGSITKVCFGRLHYNVRRRFVFQIQDGPDHIVNKEINF